MRNNWLREFIFTQKQELHVDEVVTTCSVVLQFWRGWTSFIQNENLGLNLKKIQRPQFFTKKLIGLFDWVHYKWKSLIELAKNFTYLLTVVLKCLT